MRYVALATDYDGTLADRCVVAPATLDALARLRDGHVKRVLVTGRQLGELREVFPRVDLFDRVVAENGALVYAPATDDVRMIAAPPPQALLDALAAREVPFASGRAIIAAYATHAPPMLEAIHELGLEYHLIFNKGGVMALPSGINKARGLLAALDELGVDPARTVAVGDAENDQSLFDACGYRVAVANALAALKARADLVTRGEDGAGVVEVVGRMLADELPPRTR